MSPTFTYYIAIEATHFPCTAKSVKKEGIISNSPGAPSSGGGRQFCRRIAQRGEGGGRLKLGSRAWGFDILSILRQEIVGKVHLP